MLRPQDPLPRALLDPAAWPIPVDEVTQVETHISWLVLAGDYALKLKKPVDFGFLDFATLARRRHFCEEEVRLNRRLAPETYLGVTAITLTPEGARIGALPPGEGCPEGDEYAVVMRRFEPGGLLADHLGAIDGPMVDGIADRIAAFHAALTGEPPAGLGEPDEILRPMLENFEPVLRAAHGLARGFERIEALEHWTQRRHQQLWAALAERRAQGAIRECHGDLHLGNITLDQGQPLIFDCLEFNPSLRWIDTISDLAFLYMDLHEHRLPGLGSRLLNRYLMRSGDYQGLAVLDLYLVYRAMVRAKVAALRLEQGDLADEGRARAQRDLKGYVRMAEGFAGIGGGGEARPAEPRLIITFGPSGSGKSLGAARLAEGLPAIHLRSDVERKRLFGLAAEARSGAKWGIYDADATQATYDRLLGLARGVLYAGYSVVVDATFLERDRRRAFRALADEVGVPFAILAPTTPVEEMRQWVRERLAEGRDPSEADEAVLEGQLKRMEPLDDGELGLLEDQMISGDQHPGGVPVA